MNQLQILGRTIIDQVSGLGRALLMLASALMHIPNPRKGFPLLMKQLYSVGVLSLIIVLVSGLFIGMVLALQGYTILVGYGAEASLGPMVALSLAPRFWAGFISLPLLAAIFSAVGILGAHIVGVDWLGVDSGTFWSVMQSQVSFEKDILNGIIKSVVFAFVVTWIAVYKGYSCEPTSEGISRATTSTVVQSSLLVLGLDFVLTALMFAN